MNKYIPTLSILLVSTIAFSQSNISPAKSVRIVKEVVPPVLNVVPNSIKFIEPSNNGAIDANELCSIEFQIKNSGKGDGDDCFAKTTATGTKDGISFRDLELPTIKAGTTETVRIPISANMNTRNGQINFVVEVNEPQGFGTDPIQLTINTRAFEAPNLQIVDYTVTSSNSGILKKKDPFDLQLLLQNTQYGNAEDVNVEVILPNGVFMTEGEERTSYARINGGDKKSLIYSLIVNNNYISNEIPIKITLSEKYGKYAENKTIVLKLNQTMAGSKIVVNETIKKRDEIQIASISNDVDKNIPTTTVKNKNTFAVIIANEQYRREADVPYAQNDGSVFSQYCENVLGIPSSNIHLVLNATLNDINAEVEWAAKVAKTYQDEAKIIFYYAGHGIPDESSKSAFLLPVDGQGSNITTAMSLDKLYATLGNSGAKTVTVFLDACFSGSKREGGMMASARGIAIKTKSGQPIGNMVVFSAAQGDETAYPDNDQHHGMFTYYLLKKLQESKGDVSYNELGNYIKTQVSRQSIVQNNKSQTPSVVGAASLGTSWQGWKLK